MKNKSFLLSVLASVIASLVFVRFLDPILSFLARQVLTIGSAVRSSYITRLYTEIAVGDFDHAYYLTMLLAALVIFIAMALILFHPTELQEIFHAMAMKPG